MENVRVKKYSSWRRFSPKYYECDCGYHTIAITPFCPMCGRRNYEEDRGRDNEKQPLQDQVAR